MPKLQKVEVLDQLRNDPEVRKAAREANIQRCREGIIRGNEAALWKYVGLQWPDIILDEFQRDIIQSGMLGGIKEIAIKGCTSPGKGFAVAVLANSWFDVHPKCKVIVTSSNIEHAARVMFGEITSVRLQMKHPRPAKLMAKEFWDEKDPNRYLICANPKTGEGFSGAHGPATLFVFDEASAVVDALYDNSRQQSRLIVALSNPRVLAGWFREMFRPAEDPDLTQTIITPAGPRRLITVGGSDCRNVKEKRLKEPFAPLGGIDIRGQHFDQGQRIPEELFLEVKTVIPNQMDYAKYLETMALPDEFRRRVFGEGKFPQEDAEAQLFLQSWFQRSFAAWSPDLPVDAFGLDLAASEMGDRTVLAAGGSLGVRKLHIRQKADTMQTVGWVIETAKNEYGIELMHGSVPVGVDMNGIGKAVYDRLCELGVACIPIWNNGAPQVNRDRYANRRAEVYGELSSRMSPDETPDVPFALPEDFELQEELCAHCKIPTSRGFNVTPKDRYRGMLFVGHTIKETLGRSPDKADAVGYLYVAVRSLDVGAAPTLKRDLILITPEEQMAAAIAEADEKEKMTEQQRCQARIDEEQADKYSVFAKTMGWDIQDQKDVGEIAYPEFLTR